MRLSKTLIIIFVMSLAGTLWSLYFWYFGDPITNIMTGDLWNTANALLPCPLCRYARIALYPMVIISGIWLYNHDHRSVVYCGVLSLLGALITGYQILLQAGVFAVSSVCEIGSVSCAVIDWQYLWVTIPMLACAAFIMIAWVSNWYLVKHKR